MRILWSFFVFFKRERFSFSLASALVMEFFSVVVGDEGRYGGCWGVDTAETDTLVNKVNNHLSSKYLFKLTLLSVSCHGSFDTHDTNFLIGIAAHKRAGVGTIGSETGDLAPPLNHAWTL